MPDLVIYGQDDYDDEEDYYVSGEEDEDEEDEEEEGLALLGQVMEELQELGQRRRGRGGRRPRGRRPDRAFKRPRGPSRRGRGRGRKVFKKSPLISKAPGSPPTSLKRIPLGFGSFTFTSLTATSNTFTANPQVALRPDKLIVVVTRSSGAGAVGVNVDDLQVGTRSQFASAGAVPAEAFAADADDARLIGDSAQPGIDITLQVALTAPVPANESVVVQAMLYCEGIS
jgi:hypothetical protein